MTTHEEVVAGLDDVGIGIDRVLAERDAAIARTEKAEAETERLRTMAKKAVEQLGTEGLDFMARAHAAEMELGVLREKLHGLIQQWTYLRGVPQGLARDLAAVLEEETSEGAQDACPDCGSTSGLCRTAEDPSGE